MISYTANYHIGLNNARQQKSPGFDLASRRGNGSVPRALIDGNGEDGVADLLVNPRPGINHLEQVVSLLAVG